MAITWGSLQSSADNWFRLGYEFTQSPSSVTSGTASVTVTLKLYVETQRSVVDSTNSWSLSGNFSGSGSVDINNGSGGGVDLITTKSRTISTSYNGTVGSSFSASLTGINAIPGTANVSGSHTTATRPHTPPSSPTSVSTTLSGTTLTTTWSNRPSTAGPYNNLRIRRSVDGGSYTDVSTPGGTSTSYSQASPGKNKTVRYAIRAENEAGDSAWSYGPTVSIPPDAPAAPSGLGVTRNSDTSHTIYWTNVSPTSSIAPYKNVEVQRWDNVGNTWATIVTLGVVSSYTNTSTIANRQYRWRVRSKNSGGSSGYVYTGYWSTTPSAPGTPKASKVSGNIPLTWANTATAGSAVEVWHAANGVWDGTALAVLTGQPTSYTHTAPNAAQTHQYRLKAQAGGADDAPTTYSANSAASNVIQLLTNPAAPTQLSPSSGVRDVAANDLVLSWNHNEVDGTAQTKYDLQYRFNGGTWTTVSATTATQSKTFTAGTLANGQVMDWQVRTYGLYATVPAYSPWSAAVTLTLSATPQAGVIFPSDVIPVDTSRITAQWSYYDEEATAQAAWNVNLYTAAGAQLLETQAGVNGDTSVPLTTILANGGTYRLGVTVQDGTGLWSPETTQDFTVVYALPDVPTVALLWDPEHSAVIVSVNNPAGAGAGVDHNEVWRSVDWLTYELVVENLPPNGTITDYIPAVGLGNVYKIVAVTALEAAAESVPTVFEAPPLEGWFLVNGGPAFSQQVAVRYNPELARDFSRDKSLNKYAGRTFPVETVGEHRNRIFDLTVAVLGEDDSTLREIESIADIPGPLVLRTPDSDRLYVSLAGAGSNHISVYESVGLKFTQVDKPNADSMILDPVLYQTNWASNPSFEVDATGVVTTANLVAATSTAQAYGGVSSLQATVTANAAEASVKFPEVITAGPTYMKAAARVLWGSGDQYFSIAIGYRDSATTGIITYTAPSVGVVAEEWTTLTTEATIPATSQYVTVVVYVSDSPSGTTAATNSVFYVDAIHIGLGTNADDIDVTTYFDGDRWTGDPVFNTSWLGTPGLSRSQLTRGGIL